MIKNEMKTILFPAGICVLSLVPLVAGNRLIMLPAISLIILLAVMFYLHAKSAFDNATRLHDEPLLHL